MKLDLTSLEKSVAALDKALSVAHDAEEADTLTNDQRLVIKAGVIQHFELTYEFCWKFMKRDLQHNLGRVYVDGVSRHQLFRLAAEQRLIEDVEAWMDYHHARNLTSHTYDEEVAGEVFFTACTFAAQAHALLTALELRND